MKNIFFIILVFASVSAKAQESISLQGALDSARANNYTIKNSQLLSEYQEKLKSTYLNFPATQMNFEYGQLNTHLKDNKFNVSQGFDFPTVYARQKKWLDAQWQKSLAEQQLTIREVEREVTQLYYEIKVAQIHLNLLSTIDSSLGHFVQMSEQRLEKGATTISELSAVQLQQQQVSIQKKWLEQQIYLTALQMQLLTQTRHLYLAEPDEKEEEVNLAGLEEILSRHPSIEVLEQKIKVAQQAVKMFQAQTLPSWNIGYSNQSFKDAGSGRFHALEAGVGIPVFTHGQRQQVKATRTQILIQENEKVHQAAQLSQSYMQLTAQLQTQRSILKQYETVQIPQTKKLMDISGQQFYAGLLSYVEWMTMTNQTLQVCNDYVTAMRSYFEALAHYHYIQNK